jgi:AhpD family alkylhydroperoxidase
MPFPLTVRGPTTDRIGTDTVGRVLSLDARVDVYGAWSPLYETLLASSSAAHRSGLDPRLVQMVQVRVSQINGCAYCLDRHVGQARRAGEEDHRLHTIAAWREADWFTPAEKAAFALAEEVTRTASAAPSAATVDEARRHYGDDGLAKLLLVITAINAWNMVNVAVGVRVGAEPASPSTADSPAPAAVNLSWGARASRLCRSGAVGRRCRDRAVRSGTTAGTFPVGWHGRLGPPAPTCRSRHLRAVVSSTESRVPTECLAVADGPETRYVKTPDGAYIAYQVVGDGPPDVVSLVTGSAIEMVREVPAVASYFRALASFSRVMLIDPRGAGHSDPLGPYERPTLEQSAGDVLVVLDAIGSATATLVANNVNGLLAIFFASSYPDRTASLVLDGCYARLAQAPDYPWGVPTDALDRAVARTSDGIVGSDPSANLTYNAPTALREDPEFVAAWLRGSRSSFSPRAVRAMSESWVFGDVRPLLPAIQAPTLVLYRRDDRFAGKPHATYLAERITGAKLVELPGRDNLCFVSSPEAALEEIQEFLTGARHGPRSDRVLATVVFTDIVGSTERAARLGDQQWRELLDRHDSVVRRQLERFRGKEVNTAGDGFLATFDGPGRAIHCAVAIRDAVRAMGVDVRVGVHTGEVEVRGDDLAGLAVHIGARVAHAAAAGEVLVSSTVKDLVAGSGIEFEDRGEHDLKGVPGSWRLYAVAT